MLANFLFVCAFLTALSCLFFLKNWWQLRRSKSEFDIKIAVLGTTRSGKTSFLANLVNNITRARALPQGVSGIYFSENEEKKIRAIASCELDEESRSSIAEVSHDSDLLKQLNQGDISMLVDKLKLISSSATIKKQNENSWKITDHNSEYYLRHEGKDLKLYPVYHLPGKRTTAQAVTTELSRFKNGSGRGTVSTENFYVNFTWVKNRNELQNNRFKTVFTDIPGGDFEVQDHFEKSGILKLIKEASGICFVLNSNEFLNKNGKAVTGEKFIHSYIHALDERIKYAEKNNEMIPIWFIFTKGDTFNKEVQSRSADDFLSLIPQLKSMGNWQKQPGHHVECFVNMVSVVEENKLFKNISNTFRKFFQVIEKQKISLGRRTQQKRRQFLRRSCFAILLVILLVLEGWTARHFSQLKDIEKIHSIIDVGELTVSEAFLKKETPALTDFFRKKFSLGFHLYYEKYAINKLHILQENLQLVIEKRLQLDLDCNDSGKFHSHKIQSLVDSLQLLRNVSFTLNSKVETIIDTQHIIDIAKTWNSLETMPQKVSYFHSLKDSPIKKHMRDYIEKIGKITLEQIEYQKIQNNQNYVAALVQFNDWYKIYSNFPNLMKTFALVFPNKAKEGWQVFGDYLDKNADAYAHKCDALILLYKTFPPQKQGWIPDAIEIDFKAEAEKLLSNWDPQKQEEIQLKEKLKRYYYGRDPQRIDNRIFHINVLLRNFLSAQTPAQEKYEKIKVEVTDLISKINENIANSPQKNEKLTAMKVLWEKRQQQFANFFNPWKVRLVIKKYKIDPEYNKDIWQDDYAWYTAGAGESFYPYLKIEIADKDAIIVDHEGAKELQDEHLLDEFSWTPWTPIKIKIYDSDDEVGSKEDDLIETIEVKSIFIDAWTKHHQKGGFEIELQISETNIPEWLIAAAKKE